MKTVLLVEDDPFISDVYMMSLKKEGIDADIAADGQLALDKIKNHIPDLLALDIDIPKVNGCEMLRILRDDPATKNLKIIVLSNYTDDDIMKKYDVDINSFGIIKRFLKIETPVDEIVEAVKQALI